MDWRKNRARLPLSGLIVPGLIIAVAGGCIEREGRPVNPCTQVTVAQSIAVENVDKVDLLFMVDNSNSMAEEQASLAAELPRMVEILASGDFELDGDPNGPNDFKPVNDLNVGVITSDMGVGGFTVPTCLMRDYGDDGVLRTQGQTADPDCMATYPRFMNFRPGAGPTPNEFGEQVGCVAVTGVGGCGFEQQLEAVLKAVSPTGATDWTAPGFTAIGTPGAPDGIDVPFFNRTQGHGNVTNDGFLRPNAVLAIIPVTDEEDCSAKDLNLFDPASPTYSSTDLNLRCFAHPGALHPISRYVRGLVQTRARPGLLIYAPITGIPVDLVAGPGSSPNYPALISPDLAIRDDRMEERVDVAMPNRLAPSCNVPGRGVAFPPVRIVQAAQQLEAAGAKVTVQSICQESFSGALTEIIRQIASALGAACLPRPLNPEADGSVNCDVVAVMPPDRPCSSFDGAEGPKLDDNGLPVVEEGNRAVCVLRPLIPDNTSLNAPPPPGDGWYYDTFTEEVQENCQQFPTAQRIGFTAQPPSGAEVRLECFLSVQGDGTTNVQIGTFCDPGTDTLCATAMGQSLSCDPVARSCGVQCSQDLDCRNAGLIGYVCDTRPRDVVDPSSGSSEPYNFCVNPTCG